MLITDSQLIGLPVDTRSGENLGHVSGLEIDINSQSILNYRVRPGGLVSGLLRDEFLIGRGLVITITKNGIIVEDGASRESEKRLVREEKYTNKKTATEPVRTVREV